jgi:biopolymer transport protein ExbD
MAEVQIKEQSSGENSKQETNSCGYTPMVDLGFLLITFFMFTTNFSKPNAINFSNPPKNPTDIETHVDIRNSITFILGRDGRVFYYQAEKNDLNDNSLTEVSFDKAQVAKTIKQQKRTLLKRKLYDYYKTR